MPTPARSASGSSRPSRTIEPRSQAVRAAVLEVIGAALRWFADRRAPMDGALRRRAGSPGTRWTMPGRWRIEPSRRDDVLCGVPDRGQRSDVSSGRACSRARMSPRASVARDRPRRRDQSDRRGGAPITSAGSPARPPAARGYPFRRSALDSFVPIRLPDQRMVGEGRRRVAPSSRPSRIWAGVASTRSSPRTTRRSAWRRSSTTTAKP